MSVIYQPDRIRATEPGRRTAGTLRISPAYTGSVRTLRAAVLANVEAGRGHVTGERVDDVSCEIIDIVPLLDQASRRTLRLVAGQLKRKCAGSRPRKARQAGATTKPTKVVAEEVATPAAANGPSPGRPFDTPRWRSWSNGQHTNY